MAARGAPPVPHFVARRLRVSRLRVVGCLTALPCFPPVCGGFEQGTAYRTLFMGLGSPTVGSKVYVGGQVNNFIEPVTDLGTQTAFT
jgi:hypothetical protein